MKKQLKKTVITIAGVLVLTAGLVMIPYPGPGWLVVFAGLGILASEYIWAHKLLQYAKNKYDGWQLWLKKQNPFIRAVFLLLTMIVVVLTVWILNGYGILNDVFNLGIESLRSPLNLFR